MHRLTDRQKSVIEKRFGCLLALGQTYIPSSFIRWLALCVDPDSSQFIVSDKIINISKYSFHFVLGLPNHGSEVVENSDGGLDLIMSIFHLSDVPHITFFGDKLNSSEDLTDQEVFLCFMQVVVSCFLCPSGKDRLDTKYMQQLGDPERASGFDLCRLMHKHFILGINKTIKFIKTTGRKPKVFEFCSYALAVSFFRLPAVVFIFVLSAVAFIFFGLYCSFAFHSFVCSFIFVCRFTISIVLILASILLVLVFQGRSLGVVT